MKFLKNIKKPNNWLLFLIVLSGAFLRFYNLNWDEGHFFHPDERNIAAAVSRIHFFDQLNPEFFAYGSLPLYLSRLLGDFLVLITGSPDWVSDWSRINILSRSFSAFFSTATLLLIYLLSKRLFTRKVALGSVFLAALMPSLIQTAHFGVTEATLTFWAVLLTLLCINLVEQPSLSHYFGLALVFGLALATKVAALSFLSVITVSHFLAQPRFKRPFNLKKIKKFFIHNLKLLWSLSVALIIFSIISPYTFLSWSKFQESMNYEGGVVTGRLKVVYVLQFEKTFPYLFQLKNMLWQAGPVVFLSLAGFLFLLIKGLKQKEKKYLVFLSFPLAYFLFVGSWYAKFIRYMVPLLPFLSISAAWTMFAIHRRWRLTGKIMAGLAGFLTLLWGLAFFSIYTRESTRITASKWIYQNLTPDSVILQEHWDDGLPININSHRSSLYKTKPLAIYEPDDEKKTKYYAEKLAEADYLVINSRRLYGTLIHLPEKYPLTSRYYQLLFGGRLGFQKIAEFKSYPSLFGLEINDDRSEETFQVYDHPKVMVFQKKQNLTESQYIKILSE